MDAAARKLVRDRAAALCEYCRLPEWVAEIPFHIEHIIAQQHGGQDDVANLTLACDRCNLYKGPNIASIDPFDGSLTPLFQPRQDKWDDHFQMEGAIIVGLTPAGRATVALLKMNAAPRLRLRECRLTN